MDSEPVITSIILSDLVITEQGSGKLSFIGSFNSLVMPGFPCHFPGFFATVGLTNLGAGGTTLAITIRVEVEATGHVLASSGGQVDIGIEAATDAPVIDMRKMVLDIPIRFGPLVFAQPGHYSIVVLVNNVVSQKRNFLVRPGSLLPPPQRPQGQ